LLSKIKAKELAVIKREKRRKEREERAEAEEKARQAKLERIAARRIRKMKQIQEMDEKLQASTNEEKVTTELVAPRLKDSDSVDSALRGTELRVRQDPLVMGKKFRRESANARQYGLRELRPKHYTAALTGKEITFEGESKEIPKFITNTSRIAEPANTNYAALRGPNPFSNNEL
jgi:hypothetical protein